LKHIDRQGKTEGKRLLGRPRRRWMDNINVNLNEDGRPWTAFIWLKVETSGLC
jgi:hypothetical protein